MNKLKIIIVFLFYISLSHAAQIENTKNSKTQSSQLSVNFPDTIKIKNISEKKSNDVLEKNMPWIAALLVGIISVFINLWLANMLRESNERNLQRQIDSAKEIAVNQFKATIATKNRQEWINELRHCISQFLSYSALLHPQFDINSGTTSDKSNFYDKLLYSKAKIDLLTNDSVPDQKELLDSLMNIVNIVTSTDSDMAKKFLVARNDVVKKSRVVFDIHWKKIKELK
jgi:hypothetical protein